MTSAPTSGVILQDTAQVAVGCLSALLVLLVVIVSGMAVLSLCNIVRKKRGSHTGDKSVENTPLRKYY